MAARAILLMALLPTVALAAGRWPVPVPPAERVTVVDSALAVAPAAVSAGGDMFAADPIMAAVADSDLATGRAPASAPDSTLAARAEAGRVNGYLSLVEASPKARQAAKAMYDPASRQACYAALLAPLDKRAGLSVPVKAHGWYWFYHQTVSDGRIARCQAAYQRMKGGYPLPCVIVNHELLIDPAGGKKLMDVFGGADVLLWVDVSPNPVDVVLLADFLKAYGQRVPGVILGHFSMMGGTRERLGQEDPRSIMSDADVWNFWGGFVRYALPGRSLLWIWHHHQPGRQGFDYNAKMLPKLAGLNLDGLCVWGYPGALSWSGKAGDDLAAMPKQWFGKDGLFVEGDWSVSTTLLWPTIKSDTPQFKTAAKEAVKQIAPCETKILPLGGAVRFVGRIPDSYRVLEDLAK